MKLLNTNMFKLIKQTKIQLLIIILLTIVAYSNIFQNSYQGDDYNLIINWDFIHKIENVPKIFTADVLPDQYFRFRPLGTSLIAVYYHFFGSNPFGYHLHSLIAHIIKIILVFLIVKHIAKEKVIVFIAVLIFALHPVQTESVTHIIVSLDGTGYIFFLASFLFFLKSTKTFSWLFILSLIFALLAFFSYELTLTLPLIMVLYDFCFRKKLFNLKKARPLILRHAPYFLLALSYLALRTIVLSKVSDAHYLADSFYLTMLTMSKVFILYLSLLIAPVNLSISHNVLPGVRPWVDAFTNLEAIKSQSIFQLGILFNLGILGGLGILGVKCYKKIPLVTFAIGVFFIALLPVSYILPQDGIIQERYLYLPVLSFGLILGYLTDLFLNTRKIKLSKDIRKYIIFSFLIVIIMLYSYRIYLRNKDWKDEVSTYSSIVAQTPNSIMDNFMLASAYDNQGKKDLALKYYQKTLELEPRIVNIYSRMGKIYEEKGDLKQALENYKIVLQLTPNDLEARREFDKILELLNLEL